MNIIKKAFISLAAFMLAFNAAACQVSDDMINSCIAGVGFYQAHIDEGAFVAYAENNGPRFRVVNDIPVSIPVTLWFHIRQLTGTIDYNPVNTKIVLAKLYYKIVPKTNGTYDDTNTAYKWRLAKQVDTSSPAMTMNYNTLIKLFGNLSLTMNTIKKNGDTIQKDDAIIFVWYVEYGYEFDSDSQYYGYSLKSGREPIRNSHLPIISVGPNDWIDEPYGGNGSPAFIFRVIYNGLTTP